MQVMISSAVGSGNAIQHRERRGHGGESLRNLRVWDTAGDRDRPWDRGWTDWTGIRGQASGVRCRVSGVGCPVSGIGCRVSGNADSGRWNHAAAASGPFVSHSLA